MSIIVETFGRNKRIVKETIVEGTQTFTADGDTLTVNVEKKGGIPIVNYKITDFEEPITKKMLLTMKQKLGDFVLSTNAGVEIRSSEAEPVSNKFGKKMSNTFNWKGITIHKIREAKEPYIVYHNSYSAAVQAAESYAKNKGYEIDENDWWHSVSVGPKKPSPGKTNRMSVNLIKNGKVQRKALHIQVYGRENGKYELNCYIN